MKERLYAKLAILVDAKKRCADTCNKLWEDKNEETIESLIKTYFPHGSGIDSEYVFDYEKSHSNRLVFYNEFHAMDENGYYDGWIPYTVSVTPSLAFGANITITGRFAGKYSYLKDYLHEVYNWDLRKRIPD